MARKLHFPHPEYTIQDNSRVSAVAEVDVTSQHKPIFFGWAQKGKPNVPVYGGAATLKGTFGEGTFDEVGPYYKHQHVFMSKCLSYHNAFFVRVVPDDAKTASLVLVANVYNMNITQYQKADGQFVLDTEGNKIPLTNDGEVVKKPGVVIKWSIRHLESDEFASKLTTKTTTGSALDGTSVQITSYPICVIPADSVGKWGNGIGFVMYSDPTSSSTVATAMGAQIYKLGFVSIPYGEDTPVPVNNIYLQSQTEIVLKEKSIDTDTMRNYYVKTVLRNEYGIGDVTNPSDFDLLSYPDNVSAIGARCIAVEDEDNFPEIVDAPYMVNIVSGVDTRQYPYDCVVIDTTSTGAIALKADVIHYLQGGSDGTDLSITNMQEKIELWLTGDEFPAISDQFRYPITHLYDSGFRKATKDKLVDFLGVRNDVRIIATPQDLAKDMNTMAEDISMGSYLKARLALYPDSPEFNTPVTRGHVVLQSGYMVETSSYEGFLPMTYEMMIRKCMNHGSGYITGDGKGLPNSRVQFMKNLSWVPETNESKELIWNNHLNVATYYNMTDLHYADVISTYPYFNSVASSENFADYLVYLRYILNSQWAIYSGSEENINAVIKKITRTSNEECARVFGNFINIQASFYQTAADIANGDSLTAEVVVVGNIPLRRLKVIFNLQRPSTTTTK